MTAARSILAAVALAATLVACGEKVQTMLVGATRKADAAPWQGKETRFLAPGWTQGNEASWNDQMARRAQGQNDYAPRI